METIQGAKTIASFRKTALRLAFFVMAIGLLVEVGWQLNIDWLKTPLQGTIFMNPMTAVGFILTALSIQIAGRIKLDRFIWLVKLGGLLVALLGLLKLIAIVWGLDTGIDQLLFREKLLENRIAPNTAVNFTLIGTALFFLAKKKYYKLIHSLCFLTAMFSFLAILGYFYSVMNLYAFLGLTPMALNTAIAFLMSSLAILFVKPEKGLMWVFCADSAGGKTARILMPAIIIVPSILCKAILWSHDTGSIDLRFAFVLFNALLTSIFLLLIYRIVNRLDRIDFERQIVGSDLDRELKESQEQNRLLEDTKRAMLNVLEDLEKARSTIEIEKNKDEAMLASIGEGFIAVDNEGKVMVMNRVAEAMLGLKEKDMLAKKLTDLRLEDEAGNLVPLAKRPTTLALTSGDMVRVNYYFVRKDKSRFPIAITATPIKINSKTVGLVEIIRDTTKERAIDRAKSEFVSLASHQLRTPLGIMKWYLEALEKETYFLKSPVIVRKYFDEIYSSNERVLSLVRDLLSVSRIEQGHVKNVPETIDPILTIKKIVEQMRIMAHKKGVALHLNILGEEIPFIEIDPLRFHEVMENLIGNAVEYTSKSDTIEITVKKVDQVLLISVLDTGIGISMADQKHLFTKFFRSEKGVAVNAEGSGLGLYVVKSYVEGWGGKISVESQEGKGSKFTITLPINKK